MTMLKGGNVIGLVLPDGQRLMNENGAPLTFLIEDDKGDVHELFLTVGRMGTYAMFALPPFRVDEQADAIEARAGSERQNLSDGVPVSRGKARTNSPGASV